MAQKTLEGKTIFMTGATSGLGIEAAYHYVIQGAKLVVLARNEQKSKALLDGYKAKFPESKANIDFIKGDLNSLDSVNKACAEVKQKYPKLDCIINNAGLMNFEFQKSEDGIEKTLQINLLSPILICHLLIDCLKDSLDPKIIFTASALHQGNIQFDDLEFQNNFSGFKSYRHSKLGVILLCRLLAQNLKANNIAIYSQHPGIIRTELGRNAGLFSKMFFWLMGSSPKKGAQTLIYLTETNNTDLTSGEYYAKKKVTKITDESNDLEVANRLLEETKKYLNDYIKKSSLIFKN